MAKRRGLASVWRWGCAAKGARRSPCTDLRGLETIKSIGFIVLIGYWGFSGPRHDGRLGHSTTRRVAPPAGRGGCTDRAPASGSRLGRVSTRARRGRTWFRACRRPPVFARRRRRASDRRRRSGQRPRNHEAVRTEAEATRCPRLRAAAGTPRDDLRPVASRCPEPHRCRDRPRARTDPPDPTRVRQAGHGPLGKIQDHGHHEEPQEEEHPAHGGEPPHGGTGPGRGQRRRGRSRGRDGGGVVVPPDAPVTGATVVVGAWSWSWRRSRRRGRSRSAAPRTRTGCCRPRCRWPRRRRSMCTRHRSPAAPRSGDTGTARRRPSGSSRRCRWRDTSRRRSRPARRPVRPLDDTERPGDRPPGGDRHELRERGRRAADRDVAVDEAAVMDRRLVGIAVALDDVADRRRRESARRSG